MAKIHRRYSALKGRARRLLGRMALDVLGMAGGAALAAWLCLTVLSGTPILPGGGRLGSEGWVLAAGALAVGLVCWLRWRRNRRDRAIVRAGVAGETTALHQLARALPGSYHLLPNVQVTFEGRTSEMDLVAVGPGGVCVVEVKNYAGEVRGEASAHDLTHVNHGRKEQVYNPILQVSTHVYRLNGLLQQSGCAVWAHGFVYFVDPETKVTLRGQSAVPWYAAGGVKQLAQAITRGKPELTREQIQAVLGALRA